MGPNAAAELRLGWEESEHKEFMKAIRQPLMVQTPLQLVIENLFQRIQSQAVFMQQMREKMDRIAVKDVTADELLDRIKLLEARQGESAGPKLNPFNQQEIIDRLEALEVKLLETEEPPKETDVSPEGMADFETRLQRLEKRMSGVYNLNGKLVAVEQIAAGLGVAIADLDYPTGGNPPTTPPQVAVPLAWRPPTSDAVAGAAAAPSGAAAAAQSPQLAPAAPASVGPSADQGEAAGSRPVSQGTVGADDGLWPGSLKATPQVSVSAPGGGDAAAGAGSSDGRGGGALASTSSGTPSHLAALGSGAGVSAQKIVSLGQEVAALRTENDTLREGLEALRQQVAGLRSGLGSSASESLSRLQGVEEGLGSLQAQVADLAAARRDAAARTGSEVSFADFSLFKSQMEANVAEARAHAAAATAVAERDLPALAARLEEVAEGIKKSGEPRDIDSLFHERINGLEAALGDLRTELRGSVEAAFEGAAKLEELQALADAVEGKANGEALRSLQQQTQALSAAVHGLSDNLALRPDLTESLRAAAAAGAGSASTPTGPLATKLRCLTCDQPIKQPISPGAERSGRSFLPRLESLPPKDAPPGGPGVNVAELRASREERLAGLTGVGTGTRAGGLKAADLDEYAGTGVGGGAAARDGSPGRAVERARAARVPIGGSGAGKPPGAHGKPVFL